MADYELGQSKSGEERERETWRERERRRGKERDIDRARQQRQENRLFSIVGLWFLKAQGEAIKESSSS